MGPRREGIGWRPRSTSSEKQDISTGPQAPISCSSFFCSCICDHGHWSWGTGHIFMAQGGGSACATLGRELPPLLGLPHWVAMAATLTGALPAKAFGSPALKQGIHPAGDSRRPALLPPSIYIPCQPTGTWSISPPCLGPATPGQCRANPKGMENRDAFIEYLLHARHQTRLLIAIIVFNPSTIWQGFCHFPGWHSKR